MSRANTFFYNGKNYHITITPLMARQISDLTTIYGTTELSPVIAGAVDRLHANVAINLGPIPGQMTETEVMPEGDNLQALCKLWDAKQQEVVKVALFDNWREWCGML